MDQFELNRKILDVLGIPRECIEVTITLRITEWPRVKVVRYLQPYVIVEDEAMTEELEFRLIANTNVQKAHPVAVLAIDLPGDDKK